MGYEVVIKGKLPLACMEWFNAEDICILRKNESTIVTTIKNVSDQSALVGCIRSLNNFGIEVLSVQQDMEECKK